MDITRALDNDALISIIMPMRNAAAYVSESISSIIAQSYSSWQLIVINDRSTDNSPVIVENYALKEERIRLTKNEGEGIISALNHGLKQSTGTYITRMDADDVMPVNRLQKMVNALRTSPPQTIVTGLVKYFPENFVSNGYKAYEEWLNHINLNKLQWQNIYRECVIASPNWMLRKSDLLNMGGFKNLDYPEDYHLVLKWYRKNFKIRVIPEVTLNWREHSERTSRNSHHYKQASFFKLKIKEFVKYELKNNNLLLWGTGEKGRLTASELDKHCINFNWMDLETSKYVDGIQGHSILDFRQTKNFQATKTLILLAIYPAKKQRLQIENYLSELGYLLGKNVWYL